MDLFPENELPSISASTSRRRKLTRPCDVCGEASNGAHFGAEACRACAAFFRRSVTQQRKYTCCLDGKCEIVLSIRNMCRSCRYDKCVQVGMKKTAVQSYLDMLDKNRKCEMNHDDKGSSSSSQDLISTIIPKKAAMPTLTLLVDNYRIMEKVRKVLHDRKTSGVLNKVDAKPVNFIECNAVHIKEIGLVIDFLSKSFPELTELQADQRKKLYRLFMRKFIMFEAAFFASLKKRTDILILPSGDYMDISRPELFFCHINGSSQMSKEDAIKLFAPMFYNYKRSLLEPMNQEKIDEIEFLALSSLVFWDIGLEGQTQECESISTRVRNRITDELIYYYRQMKRMQEPASRISAIMILLPPLQRIVHRLQEDIEVSHTFDVFKVSDTFYNFINGSL